MIRRAEKINNHAAESIENCEIAGDIRTDDIFEREWRAHHMRRAMRRIRQTFAPKSMSVFDRLLAGQSIASVASSADLSEQAVHKIKQRLRRCLRETIAEQIREEDECR
jgi:ABC-type phosphate transport system ATPase subunit